MITKKHAGNTHFLVILSFAALLLLCIGSCHKGSQKETEVYRNDFETNNLSGISNGTITRYNNSNVLGRYNSDGFILRLENLPRHDLIKISFDLFIHDSWDGNDREGVSGPDIWQMDIDEDLLINTTFSNCSTGFCLPQSYPLNYLNNKYPAKSGAYRTDLPGVCYYTGIIGGTSMYKIEKTIRHSNESMIFRCLDSLKQSNVSDPKCDESWSIDNIKIKVIKLN